MSQSEPDTLPEAPTHLLPVRTLTFKRPAMPESEDSSILSEYPAPDMPAAAVAVWTVLILILKKNREAYVNLEALEMYCRTYAHILRLETQIEEEGDYKFDRKMQEYINPAHDLKLKYEKNLQQYANMLGLNRLHDANNMKKKIIRKLTEDNKLLAFNQLTFSPDNR